jgi:hypothetical protein
MNFLPDLATSTPLWLAMTTVGVNAIVALLVSSVYAATDVWDSRAASVAGIATAIVAHYLAHVLGLRTRRADSPAALLLARKKRED